MKPLRLLTAVVVLFAGAELLRAETAPAAAPFPPQVVPGTELRVLPRTRPDRLYQLHIALPDSFRSHPEKKYPVVFVTDGYWDFTMVAATAANMAYDKSVPEMLVVGLGYAGDNLDYDMMRADDLNPVVVHGIFDGGGHADPFLQMIESQAIPLLEKEYRADPTHRYLMGWSAGGLFGLYALFTKPELFQGYVLDSPSVDGAWNFEREFAAAGRTTTARVYISATENEGKYYRQQVGAFYRRLASHGTIKGGLHFSPIAGVRHTGGKAIGYTEGLLYVTAPLAPETGVASDWTTDPADRPGFVINFWPADRTPGATLTPAQGAALQAHETFLSRLIADKRGLFTASTPAEAKKHYSTLMLFAADRAAVEAIARKDPGVLAGFLNYEVLQAGD